MIELLVDPFVLPFMARALAAAVLLGALGGLVGVVVVLRRLAFAADALSHTVFPGAAVGFAAAAGDGLLWGALFAGVTSAVAFTALAARRRVDEDAALAVLLTGFFAVGVVVVSRRHTFTNDLTTLLFGRLLAVDSRDIAAAAAALALAVVVLVACGKELLLRTFDPHWAAALGYRTWLLDLAANVLVALVVVSAVAAVGTVLAAALLVVPAAAARLLTARVATMVAASVAFGVVGGVVGLLVSYHASVGYDVGLAAGPSVVLTLVLGYVLAGAVAALRRRVTGP